MRYKHHITDLLKAAEQLELDFSDMGFVFYPSTKVTDNRKDVEKTNLVEARKIDLLHTKDDFKRKLMLINIGCLISDLYKIASNLQRLDEITEGKRKIEDWYDTFDDYPYGTE